MNKRYLLPLAAAVLAAVPGAAQRSIVPGEPTRGALSSTDPRLPDGDMHFDEYVFAGRVGERVSISMESTAFDTYLYLGVLNRGEYYQLQADDDGGVGTNSRMELALPSTGTFVIRASSLGEATGTYTLRLTGGRVASGSTGYGPNPNDTRPTDTRPRPGARPGREGWVEAGVPVSGRLGGADPTLDNGTFYDNYRYQGRRGERVTVNLRSTAFDAYLVMGRPGGRHGVETPLGRDDDSGGGRDARLQLTLPADGEYVIRVNSLLQGDGAYTLELQSSEQSAGGGYDRPEPADFSDGYIDPRVVAEWGMVAPGVSVDPDSWTSVAANAGMGYLAIEASGDYTWRRNGRLARGTLMVYMPPRNAEPGAIYYGLRDGRDQYYLYVVEDNGEQYMQLHREDTGRVVAYGYADPRSR